MKLYSHSRCYFSLCVLVTMDEEDTYKWSDEWFREQKAKHEAEDQAHIERNRRIEAQNQQLADVAAQLQRSMDHARTAHTPAGFSPYIRKRRGKSPTTQVPTKIHITPDTSLPEWNPPEPTPPPATSPLLPTPPPSQAPSQPQDNPTQTIPPLMSIIFTPHTIRQIKTRLHQSHTLRYQPQPPFIPPLIPILHTITSLLNTLNHLATTLPTYRGFYTRSTQP